MSIFDVASILTTILVIAAVGVLLLIVVFFATRKYDDAKRESDQARDVIRDLRKKRLDLIKQALQMFSEGNPHADGLAKLSKLYVSIDSEKKEVAWEGKYIVVMKKFMAYSKRNLPANMESAWKMSNAAINENEMMLDGAREAYAKAQGEMASFDKPPQSYAIKIGNKIIGMMRDHARNSEEADAERSAVEAGVMDPADAQASAPISTKAARKIKSTLKDQIGNFKAAASARKGDEDPYAGYDGNDDGSGGQK